MPNGQESLALTAQKPSFKFGRWLSTPLLLLFPTFLIIAVVIIIPLLISLYISFTSFRLIEPESLYHWVGLRNYIRLAQDPVFWAAFGRTLLFLTVALNLELVVGLGLALLVNRALRGRQVLRTILMFPMTFSPILVGYMFKYMFNDNIGLLNNFLQLFGFNAQIAWLVDGTLATGAILIAEMWASTSIFAILILAGLLAVPHEQIEAAQVDGASRIQTFQHILLPNLMPFIYIAMTIRSLDVGRAYDIVQVMTGGGPARRTELIWTLVGRTGYVDSQMAVANAMAFISVILSILFTYYFYRQLLASRSFMGGQP